MLKSVEIDKKEITLELDWNEEGRESNSKKSLIHASTNGFQSVMIDGELVSVNVNVTTKA